MSVRRSRCNLAIVLFLALSVVAGADDKDAGISNEMPGHKIPGQRYSSIREIDFRNAPILRLVGDDEKYYWATLRRGSFERLYRHGGGDEISLESVRYLKTAQGKELALVRLRWITVGGSSSPQGVVMVIGLDDKGLPIVRQQIEYNVRGADEDEVGARFDPANGRLRISAVHSWEHCCPHDLIVIMFQWTGEKFVLVRRKISPLRHPQ